MTFELTPWIDRTWKNAWQRVAQHVPESWLPRHTEASTSKRPVLAEYGCGHYGCVLPTHTPELVLKLTTDPTEAAFVAWSLTIGPAESGIVKYERVLQIEGAQLRNRSIYLLWRSEAYEIGFLHAWNSSARIALRALDSFKNKAAKARAKIHDWKRDPRVNFEERLGELWNAYEHGPTDKTSRAVVNLAHELHQCRRAQEELENTFAVSEPGGAIGYYMQHGVLLADVHANNVGRDKERGSVIVDPGHAVPISNTVKIPAIQTV